MKVNKTSYRKVAQSLVTEIDARHAPYANRNAAFQYTRTPTGAWVMVWVWVPQEMALLQQTKETS